MKLNSVNQIQIFNNVDFVSLRSNALGKGMNLSLSLSAIGKSLDKLKIWI